MVGINIQSLCYALVGILGGLAPTFGAPPLGGPRSIHFTIDRHAGDFENCSQLLLGQTQSDRSAQNLPVDFAPVTAVQRFYFAEMARRTTLSPDEIEYYSKLTRELDPSLVSFVSSTVNGNHDASLMVVSGQEPRQYHEFEARPHLPFERQFPAFRLNRKLYPYAWEIGRARGGEFFKTNAALSSLLMQAELFAASQDSSQGWTNSTDLIDQGYVFIHATTPAHRDLYMSRRYRFELHAELTTRGDKTEYVLRCPLRKFIATFKSHDVFDGITGLASHLEISPQTAFEIYLNIKAFAAPEYWDFHIEGPKARKRQPHYYPSVIKVSHRTKAWRNLLNSELQARTGKTIEDVAKIFDVTSELERDVLVPIRDAVSYSNLFGTEELVFVDGIASSSIDPGDMPMFLASLHDVIKGTHPNTSSDTKIVFRVSSENPVIRAFMNEERGPRPVLNPVPFDEQLRLWTRYSRLRWMSSHAGEPRETFLPLYERVSRLMGDKNPFYFYKTRDDYPVMPDIILQLSLADLASFVSRFPTQPEALFKGKNAAAHSSASIGGL